MTEPEFIAEMNRVAARYAEMAVEVRRSLRRILLVPVLGFVLAIGLWYWLDLWGPLIVSVLLSCWQVPSIWSQAQDEWEKYMRKREQILLQRDSKIQEWRMR